MSGDVFGNGMLRSDRIRLVAAFDHRDIFLDPDPDPAASYAERARLFALPRSSWQDYDRALISAGGGRVVAARQADPGRAPRCGPLLRLDAGVDHLSPPELIRAILQAPVALLFAGGIGTFVRASDEPDREIDDRANAEVRVTGSQVRARVVGEGANLAFTQRARIEYARRGGHINTDAIDNSAGVDISDREVNLKILLRPAVESGEITLAERDELLAEVCDDVVAAVLHDSARQSLALSRAQAASAGRIGAIERLMVELEAAGVARPGGGGPADHRGDGGPGPGGGGPDPARAGRPAGRGQAGAHRPPAGVGRPRPARAAGGPGVLLPGPRWPSDALRPPARRPPPAPGADRVGGGQRGGRPHGRDVRLPAGRRHRLRPGRGGRRLVDRPRGRRGRRRGGGSSTATTGRPPAAGARAR